jgi:ribosome-binding ATPase
MKIGILGLPFSGKTTLFGAITGQSGGFDGGQQASMATVPVLDERLDALAATCDPKKITHALIDFVDVAGLSADESRDRAQATLTPIRDADGLLHVIRLFDWPSAPPHPRGSLDPLRDVEEIQTELVIADLDVVERRVAKLEKQINKPTPHQEQDKRELVLQKRIKEVLEEGQPVSSMKLSKDEDFLLRSFQLLSSKPMIQVINVHEDKIDAPETKAAAEKLGPGTIIISARIEKEIAELDEEEREMFAEELGVGDPAAHRVIKACYDVLGLRTFFTGTSPQEDLHAWTISVGDSAWTAAGKIHSDIQRGFIRAEITSYTDRIAAGTLKEAKAQNMMKLEGKDHVVADGDIITFRFKV